MLLGNRSPRRLAVVFAAALSATAGLAAAPAAHAVTLRITGDCLSCLPAVAPAPGLAFSAMSQVVQVSDIPDRSALSATQVGPDGVARSIQGCRPFFSSDPSPPIVLSPYRGNGSYSVVVRTWAPPTGPPGFPTCDGPPAGETSIGFSINAAATVTAPSPVIIKRNGSGRVGRLSVTVGVGFNHAEAFYARDGEVGPTGALTGSPTQIIKDNQVGTGSPPEYHGLA